MTEFYRCSNSECGKLTPLIGTAKRKCPSCGDEGGEVVPSERVKQGLKTGVYYNIDPNTGKGQRRNAEQASCKRTRARAIRASRRIMHER